MAVAQRYIAQQYSGRGGPSGLADVLEVLLDKGLVIDAFVRVSLVGIELLTVDARVVVASVDTYLRFAEAVNRLDLLQANNAQTLGDLVGGRSRSKDRSQNGRGDSHNGRGEDRSTRARQGAESDEGARRPSELGAGSSDKGGDRSGGDDRADDQAQGSSGEGLLSRIKQRGQAF
ncbi:MAG TPA: gas vesicle protein GvpJ [Acidimicrobiales bacterium]|nr:gas vesicle protein GvpJ [Acidimicrobiales bacterium]